MRLRWRQLMRFQDAGPVVLLFNDGGAGLLIRVNAALRSTRRLGVKIWVNPNAYCWATLVAGPSKAYLLPLI